MSTAGVRLDQQKLYFPAMNIGGRISQRLADMGKSRAWLLAEVPDLSPQALSNLIIRDSRRSEWDEAIAEALGVSVLWLVYGREEAPRAADVVSEPEPPPYAKGRPLSKEALALAAYYDRLPG